MSALVLRCPTCQFPGPNGFYFKDPRTGYEVPGYQGTARQNAAKVIANRRANGHLYPSDEAKWFDLNLVTQEIYQVLYQSRPELFTSHPQDVVVNSSAPVGATTTSKLGACECGETQIQALLCPTCSGARVVGYRCIKCKRDRKG